MMKQRLLTGWHFMRWLRLGFGILLAIQAFVTHDMLSGVLSAFFLFQALSNTGCCGVNGCAVPVRRNKNEVAAGEEIKAE